MTIDWDMFFYYGTGLIDETDETEMDILQGCCQDNRSMFYFRQEGAGISSNENMAISLSNYIMSRMYVIKWVAFRNGYISDGRDELPDRRIATSQNMIGVQEAEKGVLNLTIYYIFFKDYTNIASISLPIGV